MDLVQLFKDLTDKLAALQAQIVDAEAAAKAQYDKGFADGVASVPQMPPAPPAPPEVDVEAEKAKAVAALKADLSAKYAELLVAEQASETGFAELLK